MRYQNGLFEWIVKPESESLLPRDDVNSRVHDGSSDIQVDAAVKVPIADPNECLEEYKAGPLSKYGCMAEISVSRDPEKRVRGAAAEGLRTDEASKKARRPARRRRRKRGRLKRWMDHRRDQRIKPFRNAEKKHHGKRVPWMQGHGHVDHSSMGRRAANKQRRAGSVPLKEPMRTGSSKRRADGDSMRNRDVDLRTFDGNARFVPSFRSKEANKRWRSKPRVMLSHEFAHEIGRPDSEPGGATMISMGVSRLHNAFLHGGQLRPEALERV